MARKPNRKDIKRLEAINDLIESDDLDTALSEALAFTRKRSNLIEAWEQLAYISDTLDEPYYMWVAMRELSKLEPYEDSHTYNLIVTAAKMGFVFLANQMVQRYLKRFPNGLEVDHVQSLKEMIDTEIQELIEANEVPEDVDINDMALFETGNMLVTNHEYAEGRKLSLQAAKKLPFLAAPLNNVALSYMVEGDLQKALDTTEEVLAAHPDNMFALGTKAQLLVRLGNDDAAHTLLEDLHRQSPEIIDHWVKIIESCAYAHEHQMIIDVFKRVQQEEDNIPPESLVMMHHFAGAAHAFLGEKRAARKIWEQALIINPTHTIIKANLNHYEEHGPWYFPIMNWMPTPWLNRLGRMADREIEREDKDFTKQFGRLVDKMPGFARSLSLLLNRGDPKSLEFVLGIAEYYPIPGLVEFVKGTRGTSQDRMKAARFAVEHGLLPRNQPVTVIVDGKPQNIMLHDFEVYDEPVAPDTPLPEAAQDHMEESHIAMMQGDYERAIKEADAGLAIAPGTPALLNHKSGALYKMNRQEEGDAITRQLAEDQPDYLFARIGMANICIREDRLDEAHEWLQPLMDRQRYHISEFRGLALTYIQYWIAKKENKSARYWLEMLDGIDPDSVPDQWRNSLKSMEMVESLLNFSKKKRNAWE